MYVCLEYSFNGRRKSQIRPMEIRRADKYGGTLRSRGSLLKARMAGTAVD